MILEGDDDKRENQNVFMDFCLQFFFTYSDSRRWRSPTLDRITTAKDAEEEGDEEDKKRMDVNEKVTLELTARSIIASCGLRRACIGTWSKTRWVDGKP